MSDPSTLSISDEINLSEAEKGSSLWQDAWIRLSKNRLAVAGGVILIFLIVVALLTPWIAPTIMRRKTST